MLADVVEQAAEALDSTVAMIAAQGSDRASFQLIALHGAGWTEGREMYRSLRSLGSGLSGPTSTLTVTANGDGDGVLDNTPCRSLGLGSLVASPLVLRGDVVGVLYVLRGGRAFGEQDGKITQAFANQAALTLNYRSLRRRSRQLSGRLSAALGLDEVVLESHDFDDLSGRVTDRVSELMDVEKTGVMLLDEERDILEMTPGSFRATDEMIASCRFAAHGEDTGTSRVFTSGEPYVSNDAPNDPVFRQDFIALFNTKRIMVVPLRAQGRLIGVLQISNKATPFDAEDLRRAEILAPRVAIIFELGRTVFQLRQQRSLERTLGELAVGIAARAPSTDLLEHAVTHIARAMRADVLALNLTKRERPILHAADDVDAHRRDALAGQIPSDLGQEVREPKLAGDPGSSAFSTPISVGDVRLGTLVAHRERAEPFSDSERHALTRLAGMTGLAMHTESFERHRAEMRLMRDRQRFAQGLHDDVAQTVFIAKLGLESLLDGAKLDIETRDQLTAACHLLSRSDTALRELISTLAPAPATEPLVRLGSIVEELEQEYGVPIHLRVEPELRKRLPPLRRSLAELLPRTANEAIVNAVKHARPQLISVALGRDAAPSFLRLAISDDGMGITEEDHGHSFGLASLQRAISDHGGEIAVSPRPEGGTEVVARFPIES